MNTTSTRVNDFQTEITPTSHLARPLLWSIRREFWEFRSIYLAPVGVSFLVVFGFAVSMGRMARQMRDAVRLDPMQQAELVQRPYNYAAMFLMGISFVVAVFYCLEALSTERRDRSVLFWKSLPISDFTTVLSKVSIPVVVLPLIVVALTIATHLVMLLLNTSLLFGNRESLNLLWTNLPLGQMWMMQSYHMFILHGLWMAPLYGWLLLVSAWARRLAILWAAVPFIVIGVFEKMLFNSAHFAHWMMYRLGGAPASDAYPGGDMAMHAWSHLHAGEVLFSPGLWSGLALAALCLFAASRVRRSREGN